MAHGNELLLQAAVYFAAAVVAVMAAHRLGLGSVAGYLLAGIAIGPWGFQLVAEPQAIRTFAELGVVMLLFVIGLELEPRRLWSMRRKLLGLGLAQVLGTVLAIVLLARPFGVDMRMALVAGMALSLSSTALALQPLAERSALGTQGGQATFAVLLFQDLAVIPMLALLPVLGTQGAWAGFSWQGAWFALVTVVGTLVLGHFIARPIFRHIARTRLREIFIAFALLLVLGIALLFEAAGLSMALGAFLAGVMLADSEYRHELELDIEPFKGLLLGLFFIAVGMSIDLGLFLRAPALVLGVALAVVGVKMLVLYPIAQAFGYCRRADAGAFAVALSQAGEFAFVLFGAAGSLLSAETVAVLNAAVAVSMLTTPFAFMAYERLVKLEGRAERAADEIRESNPVIVAGFGRFGQVAVRVLRGLGIGATVIDHDPGQIETVRRFGWKAYYGDATRADLLEQAGAQRARLLLVAIDDPQAAMRAVQEARRHFPDLRIVVRAHGRTDAYEYAALGVPAVRELFGSALDATAQILQALGYRENQARQILARFREYDERQIGENAPHRHDLSRLIAASEQGRRDIAQLLAAESAAAPRIDERDAAARDLA